MTVSNHKNVPTQFRHDLRQEFFTRPFCCHLVRGLLQLLFKALLNAHEHFFCLASFAQVNTLLHWAVILVGSLSTPHAKKKRNGSLLYKIDLKIFIIIHGQMSLRTYDMHLRYNEPIERQLQRTNLLHCLVEGCYTTVFLSLYLHHKSCCKFHMDPSGSIVHLLSLVYIYRE